MRLLIIGGAGYVGSHCAHALSKLGHTTVTYDNLSTGHQHAVEGKLVVGDILDTEKLISTMGSDFDAVFHFAAKLNVGESMTAPVDFFHTNVAGTLSILQAMEKTQTKRLIFSSTCAVYGDPKVDLIDEKTPKSPINPYGQSKLMVEQILKEAGRANSIQYAALRYFNAAGAAMDGTLGEEHDPETHLIPLAIRAAMSAKPMSVFGNTHPTPDGTCVRDYIHVDDLASGHIKALAWLAKQENSGTFNLGTGVGSSVTNVLDSIERYCPQPLVRVYEPAREGDPPMLVADPSSANDILKWHAKYDLNDIIQSAYAWESRVR
jgi:UDP-glucose 4-epimerase